MGTKDRERFSPVAALAVWGVFIVGETVAGCLGEEAKKMGLPRPEYERLPSDPTWLALSVQFHGHLGPWSTAGTRLGIEALQAAGAKGYFDVDVTCEGPFDVPPRSCFLDGLQVGTGATLGKRNLTWIQSDQIVVRVENLRTHRRVEVRPTARLLELLGSFKPAAKVGAVAREDAEHQQQEKALAEISRALATLPASEILTLAVAP
jgi:formylmethanofuran dehydrogenase subunit E